MIRPPAPPVQFGRIEGGCAAIQGRDERLFVLVRQGDYYKGSTYIFQGETYAGIAYSREEAKQYTSKGRAERAAEVLNRKCEGIWEVLELPIVPIKQMEELNL